MTECSPVFQSDEIVLNICSFINDKQRYLTAQKISKIFYRILQDQTLQNIIDLKEMLKDSDSSYSTYSISIESTMEDDECRCGQCGLFSDCLKSVGLASVTTLLISWWMVFLFDFTSVFGVFTSAVIISLIWLCSFYYFTSNETLLNH
eukprot:TRINITY_DN11364_c0_g1_i1.p1 TRINITY_DN11364_c0_g1~~TRINITY_DN11364_c0_g1_i1.p1  ORF type:complete len:148 (+),score=15.18 TRINITY_DN11364_c0_g1_i1:28-471(+)